MPESYRGVSSKGNNRATLPPGNGPDDPKRLHPRRDRAGQ